MNNVLLNLLTKFPTMHETTSVFFFFYLLSQIPRIEKKTISENVSFQRRTRARKCNMHCSKNKPRKKKRDPFSVHFVSQWEIFCHSFMASNRRQSNKVQRNDEKILITKSVFGWALPRRHSHFIASFRWLYFFLHATRFCLYMRKAKFFSLFLWNIEFKTNETAWPSNDFVCDVKSIF